MIDGNPHDFLDTVYSGQDVVYIYHGIKYWYQGYTNDDGSWHMEVFQYQKEHQKDGTYFLWEKNVKNEEEGRTAFLQAPLFEGKTFWEAEQDIQWVDS